MAHVVEDDGWYSRIVELSILPFKLSSVIRMISWFFITLALAFTLPILGLIIYDFALWIWRLFTTKPPSAVEPGDTVITGLDISGTSKSQVRGEELGTARVWDKPATD